MAKSLESQLGEMNAKLDESSRASQDMGSTKNRLQQENADLTRQLEEAESQVNQLSKQKASLSKALDEAKGVAEEEGRVRSKLQGENRNMQADLDSLRENLEDEAAGREDLQRLLTKVNFSYIIKYCNSIPFIVSTVYWLNNYNVF